MIRRWYGALALAVVCALAAAPVTAATITGTVFLDANANGKRDAGEGGLPGVMVSDGRVVVDTGADGGYRLESAEARALVWVSVPRDHRPVGTFHQWSDGARPADFPLVAARQPEAFLFVQISDTHIGRGDLLRQCCDRLNAFPLPLAFVVNTGDLVGSADTVLPDEAPKQFQAYRQSVSGLKCPLFDLPGNHEHVGFNNKAADRNHPFYGKGLYRQVVGPLYYSWDWGPVHFIALDGTRLPYAEALGDEQRAWLAEDLKRQPAGKPIVLFCHQSLPHLRDTKELAELLQGRRVLAGFCGHLHSTERMEMAGFPVYHTGALSGSWWSGPNPDGSPQGFRLISVRGEGVESVYTSREGPWSIDIQTPRAARLQKGVVPVTAEVLDLGRDLSVGATFAGQAVELRRVARSALSSTWQGRIDTALVPDGQSEVVVRASGEGQETRVSMQFLALNGKDAPTTIQADGVLKLQVRGVDAADTVELNGRPLGTLTPKAANDTWVELPVPRALLRRMNTLTLRAVPERANDKDDFSVGPVQLEVAGKRYYDLRTETFHRYSVGDGGPGRYPETLELYFCLP